MSDHTISIEGVSARYAAQIRELIYEQARMRLIARQAAKREQAEAVRKAVNHALQERQTASRKQPPEQPPPGNPPADTAPKSSKTTGLVVDTRV